MGYIGEKEQIRKVVCERLPDELDTQVEAPGPQVMPDPALAAPAPA